MARFYYKKYNVNESYTYYWNRYTTVGEEVVTGLTVDRRYQKQLSPIPKLGSSSQNITCFRLSGNTWVEFTAQVKSWNTSYSDVLYLDTSRINSTSFKLAKERDILDTRATIYSNGLRDYEDYWEPSGTVYYRINKTIEMQYSPVDKIDTITGSEYTSYPKDGKQGEYWYKYQNFTTQYHQGSYIEDLKAEDGTYPENGRHSDGYWYVKSGKVITKHIKKDGKTYEVDEQYIMYNGKLHVIDESYTVNASKLYKA